MKKWRIKTGDIPIIEEHPAGDLISVKELSEKLKLKEGDKIDQDLMNLIYEMAHS